MTCKMTEDNNSLVKKLGWANKEYLPSDVPFLDRCKTLENEGYGMLADKSNPDRLDEGKYGFSVVLPSSKGNKIVSTRDIEAYLEKRKGNYSSTNQEDIDMHDVQVYYMGFIAAHSH